MPAIERAVCLEAAKLLVKFEHLQEHAPWAASLEELAEELSVTESVLIDRLRCLDGDQLQALWPMDCHC